MFTSYDGKKRIRSKEDGIIMKNDERTNQKSKN